MRQKELAAILKEDDGFQQLYLNNGIKGKNLELMERLIEEISVLHSNSPTSQQSRIANDLDTLLNTLID